MRSGLIGGPLTTVVIDGTLIDGAPRVLNDETDVWIVAAPNASPATFTMPSLPDDGDSFSVVDGLGNAGSQPITIQASDQPFIASNPATLLIQAAFEPVTFVYSVFRGGWLIFYGANAAGDAPTLQQQTFLANGTFNVPSDVDCLVVGCVGGAGGGGGGGGGTGDSSTGFGQGGGGGGAPPLVWTVIPVVVPGSAQAVVVGAGGAAGAASGPGGTGGDGGPGGDSTFGAAATFALGRGGSGGGGGGTIDGGAGGAPHKARSGANAYVYTLNFHQAASGVHSVNLPGCGGNGGGNGEPSPPSPHAGTDGFLQSQAVGNGGAAFDAGLAGTIGTSDPPFQPGSGGGGGGQGVFGSGGAGGNGGVAGTSAAANSAAGGGGGGGGAGTDGGGEGGFAGGVGGSGRVIVLFVSAT